MLKEFKTFALRGNVLDLAVGVMIGAAFNAIIQSLVNDVLLAFVAALFGQPDFAKLTIKLGDGLIAHGKFISAVVNFVLVAIVLFVTVKLVNKAMTIRDQLPEAPMNRSCPECLSAIPIAARRCAACTSEVEPLTS